MLRWAEFQQTLQLAHVIGMEIALRHGNLGVIVEGGMRAGDTVRPCLDRYAQASLPDRQAAQRLHKGDRAGSEQRTLAVTEQTRWFVGKVIGRVKRAAQRRQGIRRELIESGDVLHIALGKRSPDQLALKIRLLKVSELTDGSVRSPLNMNVGRDGDWHDVIAPRGERLPV